MIGNIFGLNGDYDNRHIETQVNEDYIFIEINTLQKLMVQKKRFVAEV